jgi:hypothetical protein
VRRLAILASAVFVLAGCGGDGDDGALEGSGTTTSRSTPTSAMPTTTEPGPPVAFPKEGSSPPKISGDGRYFGYIRGADASARTIDFDVAQFFYGESVQKAAEDDGAVPPGEPVPNDHYERNPDQKVETLQLAQDVSVNAAPPASFLMSYVARSERLKCERGASPVRCTQLPLTSGAFFKATKNLSAGQGIPVWVTLRNDLVERVDEQYFP